MSLSTNHGPLELAADHLRRLYPNVRVEVWEDPAAVGVYIMVRDHHNNWRRRLNPYSLAAAYEPALVAFQAIHDLLLPPSSWMAL